MKTDERISDKLDQIVIEAIKQVYSINCFLEEVHFAMTDSIFEGHIFKDYQEYQEIVENPEYFYDFSLTDNWEDLIKVALEKKGLKYNEELARKYYKDRKEHDERVNSFIESCQKCRRSDPDLIDKEFEEVFGSGC